MREQDLLADQLEGARDWTRRLIADLKGDDWLFQPSPGLAHALFLCGHLAVAQDLLIHTRCLGAPILDDSFKKHFTVGKPVPPPAEYKFPSIVAILPTMEEVHEQTLETIRGMSDEVLAEPAFGPEGKPHPHYRDKRGAVSHCARHEAFHAGQIATIRRLLGRTFLR